MCLCFIIAASTKTSLRATWMPDFYRNTFSLCVSQWLQIQKDEKYGNNILEIQKGACQTSLES